MSPFLILRNMENETNLEAELAALEAEYSEAYATEDPIPTPTPSPSVEVPDLVPETPSVPEASDPEAVMYARPRNATVNSSFGVIPFEDLVSYPGFSLDSALPGQTVESLYREDGLRITSFGGSVVGEIGDRYIFKTYYDEYITITIHLPKDQVRVSAMHNSNWEYYTGNLSRARQEAEREKQAEKEAKELKGVIPKRIEEVKEIAEAIHPGNWDFQKISEVNKVTSANYSQSGFAYQLVIHFPEITISNSRRKTHLIRDIFVYIYFDSRMKHCYNGLRGARTTFTKAELSSDYSHSHLSGLSFTPNGFCTGSGYTVSLIGGLVNDGWDPDNLRNLLMLLYTYVGHESLEGGPYRRIENIALGSSRNSYRRLNDSELNNLGENTLLRPKRLSSLTTKFSTKQGISKFLIEADGNLEKHLVSALGEDSAHCIYRTPSGTYVERGGDSSGGGSHLRDVLQRISQRNSDTFQQIFFKGKHIPYKVIGEEKVKSDNFEIVPRAYITQHVAGYLEEKVNNYTLNKINYESSSM